MDYNKNNRHREIINKTSGTWRRKPQNQNEINKLQTKQEINNQTYIINKDFWKPDKSISSWYLASIDCNN